MLTSDEAPARTRAGDQRERDPAARSERRALARTVAVSAGALVALLTYAVRVLNLFGWRFTDEDQAIYWYAAREFLHLRVREPCFYGQAYNTLLASVPVAVLVGVGVPEWIAVPSVSLALGLTPWLLLAHLSWRDGARLRAAAILTAPLLLTPAYLMVLCLASYNEGLFLASLAFWLAADQRGAGRALGVALLLTLGVVVNPNSLLFAGPVGLLLILERWWGSRRELAAAGVGGALGVAFKLASDRFYASHPSYKLHPAPKLEFVWSKLWDGLANLSRHWGDLAPAPALSWLEGALVLGSALWLLRSRRWRTGAILLGSVLVLLGSFGFTKVYDGSTSVFYPFSRMYLGLPLLACLSVTLALDEGVALPGRLRRFGLPGVVAVLLVGALHAHAVLGSKVAEILDQPDSAVTHVATSRLLDDCRRLDDLAKQGGASWVFDWNDRSHAYGCSALSYGRVTYLYTPYERRTWLLEQAQSSPATHVMLTEMGSGTCSRVPAGELHCEDVDASLGVVLLVAPEPRPALDFARAVGMQIREF